MAAVVDLIALQQRNKLILPNVSKSYGIVFFKGAINERRNRWYLLLILIACLIQLICFKSIYPFPDLFSDSNIYVTTASLNLNISIWPIGYSKFLSAVHFLNTSSLFLVIVQYVLIILASAYLYFSILILYKPHRWIRLILFAFLFFNPLFIYLGNCISSDALFTAISIIWITNLLWIIHGFRPHYFITQAILLLIAFSVRYNALYYPIISTVAIIFSTASIRSKMLAIAISIGLIMAFLLMSGIAAREMTGKFQFTLSGGWQLANNALYMYDQISTQPQNEYSIECAELDSITKDYFASRPPDFGEKLENFVGNYFIHSWDAPLKKYMLSKYVILDDSSLIVSWGKVSPIFSEYGTSLISKHPFTFLKYFVLLNTSNYLYPPLEKLGAYKSDVEDVHQNLKDWFKWTNVGQIRLKYIWLRPRLLGAMPPMFLIFNLYFLGTFTWILIKRKQNFMTISFGKSVILIFVFMLVNFCFSILSSIVMFSYQVVPFVICFIFSLLLLESLLKRENQTSDLQPNYSHCNANSF